MRRSVWFWLSAFCFIVAITTGCEKTPVTKNEERSNTKIEPRVREDEPPSVVFDVKPNGSDAAAGFQAYDCTYQAQGKMAKFRLQFRQKRPMAGDIPVAPGEGKFLAVAGSDNSALLRDLKIALDAKNVPLNSPRISELAFDAVVLGEKQSRGASGGFASRPPGDWVTIKIFLPKGGDDGEVFLNLNPVLGKGEFSIKDSDYGDYLLKELAQVL
jgi:hypothetical protein